MNDEERRAASDLYALIKDQVNTDAATLIRHGARKTRSTPPVLTYRFSPRRQLEEPGYRLEVVARDAKEIALDYVHSLQRSTDATPAWPALDDLPEDEHGTLTLTIDLTASAAEPR